MLSVCYEPCCLLERGSIGCTDALLPVLTAFEFSRFSPWPSHIALSVNPSLLICIRSCISLLHPSSFLTTMQMCTHLHKRPLACVILFWCSWVPSLHLPLFITTLLFCGDIKPNPGLPILYQLSFCAYNIRLLRSNDHITALHDLADTHHPNLITLTKPGLTPYLHLMNL